MHQSAGIYKREHFAQNVDNSECGLCWWTVKIAEFLDTWDRADQLVGSAGSPGRIY